MKSVYPALRTLFYPVQLVLLNVLLALQWTTKNNVQVAVKSVWILALEYTKKIVPPSSASTN